MKEERYQGESCRGNWVIKEEVGRPKARCKEVLKDIKKLKIQNWQEKVKDEKNGTVSQQAKVLQGLYLK